MKLLDRYVIREVLTPFLMALSIFTFLLAIQPALEKAQDLLSKGVDLATVGFLLLTLLPQALGLSLPMAFLAGLLMGLGRLSADREAVALLACGVSPLRILRPILLLAVLAGAANMYVLMELIPDSNQAFRVRTTQLLASQSEADIQPGMFYDRFPGKVLYVQERRPTRGWNGVFLADTTQPGRLVVTAAPMGFLELNEAEQQVSIVLPGESVRYTPGSEANIYDMSRAQDLRFAIPASSVFSSGLIAPGIREMRIPELRKLEADRVAAGFSPHNEIIQRHQMFSFPVACLVFAVIGLALGLHSRKEGKLSGFTLGIAVLFAYFGVMVLFEDMTKGGRFPAEWARWMPNIVLGLAGLLALRWRTRAVGREITLQLPRMFSRRPAAARAGDGTSVAGRPKIVVIIRIPEFGLPRPRLLDLYISRRYLTVVVLSFAGLLGLYYIGTIIDKSERLFKGQADGWMLAQFLYYSTPQFLAYIVPMAILFAVLATIGGLTRTGELVVMRSCGVSLYRAALPLLVLGLVWSGGLFFLDDRVLARANREAEAIDNRIKGGTEPLIEVSTTSNWLVDTRGRIYHYASFDAARQTMRGVTVFEPLPKSFQFTSHTWASKATFVDGAWRAERGWIQRFSNDGRATRDAFRTRKLDLDPPDRFAALQNQDAEMMTFGELRRHIDERSTQGLAVVETRVTLQERIAFPMAAIVMTILGVPFGATTGRRGSLYGVGLALILGVGYWLANTFFLAVGEAGLMPPMLAAWTANLVFLALAAYTTLTVRT